MLTSNCDIVLIESYRCHQSMKNTSNVSKCWWMFPTKCVNQNKHSLYLNFLTFRNSFLKPLSVIKLPPKQFLFLFLAFTRPRFFCDICCFIVKNSLYSIPEQISLAVMITCSPAIVSVRLLIGNFGLQWEPWRVIWTIPGTIWKLNPCSCNNREHWQSQLIPASSDHQNMET